MKKISTILFDFDGTLSDTMALNFKSWQKAFSKYNVEIREDDYYPLEGMQLKKIAKLISERYKVNTSEEEIIKAKEIFFKTNYKFSTYEGVEELISLLKINNVKIAIVSGANIERLNNTVPKEFLDKFDLIITEDKLSFGKPHPEPYLLAMQTLGSKADGTIVIENAPLGIKSAKSANCFCIAICSTLSEEYLKEADIIVKEFKEIKNLELIRRLAI